MRYRHPPSCKLFNIILGELAFLSLFSLATYSIGACSAFHASLFCISLQPHNWIFSLMACCNDSGDNCKCFNVSINIMEYENFFKELMHQSRIILIRKDMKWKGDSLPYAENRGQSSMSCLWSPYFNLMWLNDLWNVVLHRFWYLTSEISPCRNALQLSNTGCLRILLTFRKQLSLIAVRIQNFVELQRCFPLTPPCRTTQPATSQFQQ